jgi:two-component system response regulator HydG
MSRPVVLVVDDDAAMRTMLCEYLESAGHEVVVAASAIEAIETAASRPIDLVLSDLRMEGMDGLELTRRLLEAQPGTPVVIMTAFGSIETAIEAMRAGAQNFLTKPFKMSSLQVVVDRAIEEKRLREENRRLRREVSERYAFGSLVGKSRGMQELYDLIERVAPSASNVLVIGESGTGKELVARAVHYGGPRANRPFIPLNCTSLPENLLESELFGHVKGSFTGAVATKKGLIEAAEGGTLFLDEIGDLDLALQAKLLRVIEDREVRPVGAVSGRHVDVRLIAATHRNLARAIDQAEFREDLYFRLNVITLKIPPLRDRRDDIPLLARHFLKRETARIDRKLGDIPPEVMAALCDRPWRGNVRELENVIERAVVLARGDTIALADVEAMNEDLPAGGGADSFLRGRPTLDELEERYVGLVLEECGGDKAKAARLLGISTRTLYRRDRR